jgi:hypothetical protein
VAFNPAQGTVAAEGGLFAENGEDCIYTWDTVRLEAAVNLPDHKFCGWMSPEGAIVSTDNPHTFTVTADTTLVARFARFTAECDPLYGRVETGDAQGEGQVMFTAAPRFGYRFVNWTSPEGEEVSAENPCTLALTGDTVLTAHFTLRNSVAVEALPAVGEAQAGYGGGCLHLVNLEGYDLSVVSSNGRVRYRSKVKSADEKIRIHLPAGIYILSAVRGGERKNFKTIAAR